MRKIIVLEHITLDGVIQGPGGPHEDTSENFKYGGWIEALSDEVLGKLLRKQMDKTFDLLLGRKTFDNWASYWPQHGDAWEGVNKAVKYVASNKVKSADWQPFVFINEDIVEKVSQLKQQDGPDLNVWGSSDLVQTLLRHDLVDVFWLMIYPITLGRGKRLFREGTIPTAFKVTESTVTPKGVIVVRLEREGMIAESY
ncbi:dihydrofolate reductase family protein [Proteiniclasticum sp.]|uniref:dihydrofolate reductase family protein n=1 Tax=Proteiniclasticum sp. TaxID=2053595 RepID=UPI00289FE133|nr:dihydrofolate reductase family protein [Proteiniclasticum sp.]